MESDLSTFTGLTTLKKKLKTEFRNRTGHVFKRFKFIIENPFVLMFEGECAACHKKITVIIKKYEVVSDYWIRVFGYRIRGNGIYKPCGTESEAADEKAREG